MVEERGKQRIFIEYCVMPRHCTMHFQFYFKQSIRFIPQIGVRRCMDSIAARSFLLAKTYEVFALVNVQIRVLITYIIFR